MISERIVWLVAGVVLGVPLGWVLPGLVLLFQEERDVERRGAAGAKGWGLPNWAFLNLLPHDSNDEHRL